MKAWKLRQDMWAWLAGRATLMGFYIWSCYALFGYGRFMELFMLEFILFSLAGHASQLVGYSRIIKDMIRVFWGWRTIRFQGCNSPINCSLLYYLFEIYGNFIWQDFACNNLSKVSIATILKNFRKKIAYQITTF